MNDGRNYYKRSSKRLKSISTDLHFHSSVLPRGKERREERTDSFLSNLNLDLLLVFVDIEL